MWSDGIAEVVLVVADVPASARFYREVVGLAPATEPNDEWAWFWTGAPERSARLAVHRGELLFEEHSPHPPGRRWGQVHFALNVPGARIEAALAAVTAAGLPTYGPHRFEWMRATGWYFYDPDGNLVEYWVVDEQ